jgi:hypothetical protein
VGLRGSGGSALVGGQGGRGRGGRSGGRGGRRGRRSSRRRGGGQWLNIGSPCLIGHRLISRIERRVGVQEGSWGLFSQKDLGRGARV